MGKMGIDEIGEGANWPLAVDGRCSDEWPDAVIIQICNVCAGNCSNISNMQCMCGKLFKYFKCNVYVGYFSNMQCMCAKLFKHFKYAMLTRGNLSNSQICDVYMGYCSNTNTNPTP